MTDYPTLLRAELARLPEQVEAARHSRYIGDRILLADIEAVAAGRLEVEPDTLKRWVRRLREILNQSEPSPLRIIDGGKPRRDPYGGKKEPKPVQVVGNLGMFE